MIQEKVFHTYDDISEQGRNEVIDFLYKHLDEFGDAREDIEKAVDYSLNNPNSEIGKKAFGGFILTGRIDGELIGAVVINKTGMHGYIPENILVYIAAHRGHRGKGIGKQLMNTAVNTAEGDVALHVEDNNPAKFLYEKVGFTNKYLEMRYKQPQA